MRKLMALVPLFALAGCPKPGGATSLGGAGSDTKADVPQAEQLTTSTTADGLVEVKVDLNRDGKPEITNYFRERADAPRLLVRKDTDLNRDGKVDVRSEFDDAGQRVQEQMDGDFDGRTDWVDHYIGGKRTTSDIDTDFNGSFDLFKYYENGKVRRKERDTDGDGRIDSWEYLDETGTVVKTGKDIDGDGKMDSRDQ
jgi:antitoxin component YwqK of YwqJK toxin-antitoxin module